VLAAVNIGYIGLNLFEVNLLSFAFYKILIFLVISIVKYKVLNIPEKECCCFKQESISKVYYEVHDKSNKILDCLRKIVFLHDFGLLLKTLIVLVFIISLGNVLSTLSIVLLLVDLCAVYCYIEKNEGLRNLKETAINAIETNIFNKIPKYVEKTN